MKYDKNSPEWLNIVIKSDKWFTYESMRFFGSRIHWNSLTPMGEGWLFITSEHNFDRTQRLYSIRKATNDKGVTDTLSWQETGSLAEIRSKLKQLIIEYESGSLHPEYKTRGH